MLRSQIYIDILHCNLPIRYGVLKRIGYLLNKLRVKYCILKYIGFLHYNLPVRYDDFKKICNLLNKLRVRCCVLKYIGI